MTCERRGAPRLTGWRAVPPAPRPPAALGLHAFPEFSAGRRNVERALTAFSGFLVDFYRGFDRDWSFKGLMRGVQ